MGYFIIFVRRSSVCFVTKQSQMFVERLINQKYSMDTTFLVRETHLPVVFNSIVNRARWLFFLNALVANA